MRVVIYKKPRARDWVYCAVIPMVGAGLIVFGALTWNTHVTPENELALGEGVASDVTVTHYWGPRGGSFDGLKFTIGGYRIEYGSRDPNYEQVRAAVQSGQPLRAWVSPRQASTIGRPSIVPLYKMSRGELVVLDYATTAAERAKGRPTLMVGGGAIMMFGGLVLYVTYHRYQAYRYRNK
jgi:hypothetical protein